jgi:integrase
MIAVNPARGARKLAGSRRRKRLSLDQISELGTAMRETNSENPVAISALRFILLSGFRRNEALSIQAEQLIGAGGVDLPDSKSGPQVRAIGRSAMAVLKSRASEVGDLKEAWLFPAERGDGHFVGLPKVLARICRRAKLDAITLHTLRHSFASVAGDIGYSELVIAGLLGHSAGSVTSTYVHLDKALVAAADQTASTIAAALDGKAPSEVIPLRLGLT